jgi:ribosome-binding factor A
MVSQNRASRIAKGIQEMLSEILLFEVTDPRLQGVYVTDVSVDRELSFATVHVSALEGAERRAEILAGFKNAAGFLRSQLAQRTELRSFPKLRFTWDETPEHAEKIEKLIAEIHEKDAKGKQGG